MNIILRRLHLLETHNKILRDGIKLSRFPLMFSKRKDLCITVPVIPLLCDLECLKMKLKKLK